MNQPAHFSTPAAAPTGGASDYLTAIRRWLFLANKWLDTWVGRLYLASATAAVYVYAYQHHPARPGASSISPLGWFGWWDQGQYLKSAAGLAHGSLTQETYWYPLGYPALGALFYRIWPEHCFFLPDLFLITGIALLFYQIARRLVTPVESVLLLALFVFSYRGTLSLSMVEPWNTIPTHFLTYAIILLVGLHEPSRNNIFLAVICVGLAYLCRPADAVCAGLVVAIAVLRLPAWKEKIKVGLAGFSLLLVFVGGVLLINRAVFSAWRTTYDLISANIGFGSYPLTEKIFLLVIDAGPIFGLKDTALLAHFPWLVLLPPGVFYFVRKFRWGAVGVLLSMAATYGLYFAYNDFWPGNIFHYHLIHYLVWTFPVLALLTYIGLREAWIDRGGRWSLASILPVLLLACFLTLGEDSSGRIKTASLPDPKIATLGPGKEWIFLRESNRLPKLRNGTADLQQYVDYIVSRQHRGSFLHLSKAARKRIVKIDPTETPELQTIEYGTLKWRLKWPPRPLTPQSFAAPKVAVLGKLEGVDLAGPQGTPDGQPDQVLEIRGETGLLKQVASWDIETTDKRGHWVSAANANGWWLVKVAPPSATASQNGRTLLRLYFPDYGDFDRASGFTLRATDIDGNLVINQTIPK